ncbi:hypothetical protein diail_5546 [Diaporthe ilicicola]|nr:hypothetical protein diail_5546 [Diaporthe ilicicola]
MATTEPGMLAAIWVLFVFSTTFLSLRLWCHHHYAAGFWWDDYILLAGWGSIVAANISASVYLVAAPDDGNFSILFAKVAAAIACALTKTAFCVTVLRLLSPGNHPAWKWLVWYLMVSFNMATVLLVIRQWARMCVFDYEEGDVRLTNPLGRGHCWPNEVVSGIADFYMAYSAITDCILSLIPLQLIFRIRLSAAEKAGAAAAMGCGVLVSIVPFCKLILSQRMRGTPAFSTWFTVSMGLDIIEPLLTIVAQSIPILRVLIRDTSTGYESSKYVTNLKSRAWRYTSSLNNQAETIPSKLDIKPVRADDDWDRLPSPAGQNCRRRSVMTLYELEPVRPYPAVSSMLGAEYDDLKEEWAN